MLGRFRKPGGGASQIAVGLAFLALAGFILFVPLPRVVQLPVGFVAGLAAAVCIWRGWTANRQDPYDLNRLWERDEPEEPHFDTVDAENVSAPYCGWCDEANAPGAQRCRGCGRPLG
jgi:ribosomal protein L40E